jgi:hypothetical protein
LVEPNLNDDKEGQMPERIDARPALTMIGGALLLAGLFMTWYVVPAAPPAVEGTDVGNAWAVFESLDLIMAAIAIGAIYVAYEQLTGEPRLGAGWLLPLGLLALVIVVSQILDPPPLISAEVDPGTGAWLGLGGAAAMVVGGALSAAHVTLSLEMDSASGPQTTRRSAAQGDA